MGIILPTRNSRVENEMLATGGQTEGAWRILASLGAALFVMGWVDIALAWYPLAFGNSEWEFGAISATLNGMALPTIGLFFLLAGLVGLGYWRWARALAVTMFVMAAMVVILAIIYATVVPLALSSVSSNLEILRGMKKAIAKASMLFVVYLTLFVGGGMQAWKKRGPRAERLPSA
jgi:hypothetical protein